MRRTWFTSACIISATFASACAPYLLNSGPARSSFDQVLDEQLIAMSHQSNVWLFLRDHAHQYYFVEDAYGRAVAIRGERGHSSIVLAGADMPMVIVDGARLIDLDVLQQMPLDAVNRIEIVGGGRGTALEGTNAGSGVIYIHTYYASSQPDTDRQSASTVFDGA